MLNPNEVTQIILLIILISMIVMIIITLFILFLYYFIFKHRALINPRYKKNEEETLLTMDHKKKDDLSEGVINTNILNDFKMNGIVLQHDAKVTKINQKTWKIVDKKNSYLISEEIDKLNVIKINDKKFGLNIKEDLRNKFKKRKRLFQPQEDKDSLSKNNLKIPEIQWETKIIDGKEYKMPKAIKGKWRDGSEIYWEKKFEEKIKE